MKGKATNYWFTIEPYVFIGLTKQYALLYNTLDGATIESDKIEVIDLLRDTMQKDNHGVILLTEERCQNLNIKAFVGELRKKYMGDIIDVALSRNKPVQLLPYFNFSDVDRLNLYKRHNFSFDRDILKNLFEINIHIDIQTDVEKLISFLKSVPEIPTFNIIGNMDEIVICNEILTYFNQYSSVKNIICSYKHLIALQPNYKNNFSYKVSIKFPIDEQQWNRSKMILLNQDLPVEYVFEVSSIADCQKAELFVEKFQIKRYRLNPIYTGQNLLFFEENVFLSKEDIFSTIITIKDFFSRQAINLYDFGKINILSNGDVYANLNRSMLGNIGTENIYQIVQKEIDNGESWFNIRNHAPCNSCVYQWFCPSPSDYEINIGRSNLCHIKK